MASKYSNVIVVGIDGAGAFIRDAATPNFDRIFADGAVTYSALSSNPSISAECWGAMLLGVECGWHGLTNAIVCERLYTVVSQGIPTIHQRNQLVLGAVIVVIIRYLLHNVHGKT